MTLLKSHASSRVPTLGDGGRHGGGTKMMIALSFLLQFSTTMVVSVESPYLKEILMGRCYEQSVVESYQITSSSSSGSIPVSECDTLVGGFMNVLESRLQQDITIDDFKPYVSQTDFTSPYDSALLWLRFWTDMPKAEQQQEEGENNHSNPSRMRMVIPPKPFDLVTPHDTPGGKLLDGLVFCASGSTTNDNCNRDESNAYWQFWKAAYAKFASQISGKLRIVIEGPFADVKFLEENALSYLDPNQIPSIEIWTPALASTSTFTLKSHDKKPAPAGITDSLTMCTSKVVAETIDYLVNFKGFPEDAISCKEDLYTLILCHSDPTCEPCLAYELGKTMRSQNATVTPKPSSKHEWQADDDNNNDYYHPGDGIDGEDGHRFPFWRILVWVIVGATFYYLYTRIVCHHLQYRGGTHGDGYRVVGNGKTFIEGDDDDDDYGATNVRTTSQQSAVSLQITGGSSNGAESFFLNDPDAAQRDAASRLIQ
jgi:ADP-ribosyl cyclase